MSAHLLLLVCAAVVSAVPLPSKYYPPTTTGAPPPPPSSLIDINSKLTSSVITGGGAIVSTTGSTSGAARVSTVIRGPGLLSETTAAGQTGVSGNSASAGDGLSLQENLAKTVVDVTDEGTLVQTGTKGMGVTAGEAAAAQKAGAQGGVKNVKAVKFIGSDGKNAFQVEHVERTAGKSASGYEASSQRSGTFGVLTVGSTFAKRPGLPTLPKPQEIVVMPEPGPEYWHPTPEPVPSTAAPTTASPEEVLSSQSKAKQDGKTTGAGAISSTGATQGSTSSETAIKTPTGSAKQSSVANSGVSSTAVSSGNGTYNQGAIGKTEVVKTKEGVKVSTGSNGFGETDGTAGIIHNVAANGGFTGFDNMNIDLPVFNVGSEQKVTGTSSTGHKASIAGPGKFTANNGASTDIKLKAPDLDSIEVPTLPPTTTTAEPSTPAPDFKLGKW